MKKWFMAVVIAVYMTGCSTLEVQVDYDSKYDFSTLSTFSVVYTKKNDENDFNKARISKLLEEYMQGKGYKNVDKSRADFYITMHLDVQKKSQLETNYETIGIRPNPYMYQRLYNPTQIRPDLYAPGGLMGAEPDVRVTTRTYEYEEGKLILEIFDVKQNSVVWQGIARDELSARASQEEKSAYINKVIEKLFKDFPQKR